MSNFSHGRVGVVKWWTTMLLNGSQCSPSDCYGVVVVVEVINHGVYEEILEVSYGQGGTSEKFWVDESTIRGLSHIF
ncbi:hypothetical protein V2J09_012970 [Rumex salicifolius]